MLSITDRDILLQCANDTGLRCLMFASEALLNEKSYIVEATSKLNISPVIFATYIPDEFKLDPEVLQMATRIAPFKLRHIINCYNYNPTLKSQIDKLFSDKGYALKLIEYHFKNVLSNPKYVEELFTAPDLLWFFDLEILENIENTILCGPEPTKEREKLRQKIYKDINLPEEI